jgi:hypothetical protein
MPPLDELDRGDRVDVHMLIPARDLDIIDRVAAQHRASRAAVISAWAHKYEGEDLAGIPQRRGGRKTAR